MNRQIRAREVRLVGPDGAQLGIMSLREALRLAEEQNLDLVEVAPNAKPPVCRIMDFGRYRYEQQKRERENRKRQKTVTIKEVRMSPKIEEHDFAVKSRNAQRFLQAGDKVKVSVRFRGREIVHSDLVKKMLDQLAEQLSEHGQVELQPRLEGRQMIMILAPKPSTAPAQKSSAKSGASAQSSVTVQQ
ncbi:MAG: translation initiation factor IF-3 [Firmicutes bacterium]|nr:translation initiation factor IF-3 [Bacillota bacterium]MBO2519892.1 translation initiation factor IF-3 [Bacillota bacterium]